MNTKYLPFNVFEYILVRGLKHKKRGNPSDFSTSLIFNTVVVFDVLE